MDLLFDEGRGLRLNASAFNNEFFAKACQEWRERLVRGDFTPEAIQKNRSDYDSDRRRLDPWKVRHFEPLWGLKRVYDLNNIIPEVGELDWADRVNKVESGENRTPDSAASCGQSDNKVEGDMCVDSPTANSASNSIESNRPVLGKRLKIEEDPPVSSSLSPGGEKCRQTLMVSPTKSPRVTVTDTTEEITDLLLVSGEPSAAKRRRLDLAEAEPSVTTAEESSSTVEESKVLVVDNLAHGSESIVPSVNESVCSVLDSGRECEMDSLINETNESESSKNNNEDVIKIEENKRSHLLVEDKTGENSSEEGNGGEQVCDTWADKEIDLMDTGTGSKELLKNNEPDDSDNKKENEVASRDSMLETKDDGLHQLPINAVLSAETSEHGLASVDTDQEKCEKPKDIPVLPLSPASANPSSPAQSAYSPKQINSRQSSSEDSIPAPVLTSEEPLCMMFDIEDRAPSSMESTLPPTLSPNCEPEMLDVEQEEEETDSRGKVIECVGAVSPEPEDRVQSPPLEEEVGPVGEKQDIITLGSCDIAALTDEQVDEKKPSVTVAASEISEGSYGGEPVEANVDSCEEESSCSYGETEDVGASSPGQQQVLNGPEDEGSHAIASDSSRCDSSRSGSSVSVTGPAAAEESENIGETETEEGKEMEVAGGEGNSCETVSEAGEGGNETTAGAGTEVCHQVQLETSPIPGSESLAAAAATAAATASAAAVPAVLQPDAENVSSQSSSHTNEGVGSLLSSMNEDGSCPAANFAEDSDSRPPEPANGIISLNNRPSVSVPFYF